MAAIPWPLFANSWCVFILIHSFVSLCVLEIVLFLFIDRHNEYAWPFASLGNLMPICAVRTSDLGELLVFPQESIIDLIS